MDTNYILGTLKNGAPITLSPDERRRHIETIGKTGNGKSSLLYNLMRADFASGRGFAFIDPHGDQAATIADATPKDRINDAIYLDAADLSHSIGWNPIERVEPDRRSVVAAQIAQAFAGIWHLSTAETPRLLYILDRALRLLLDNNDLLLRLGEFASGDQSGQAGADNDDVRILGHAPPPSLRRQIFHATRENSIHPPPSVSFCGGGDGVTRKRR